MGHTFKPALRRQMDLNQEATLVYTVISRIARATKETCLQKKRGGGIKIWEAQETTWKYFYQTAKRANSS